MSEYVPRISVQVRQDVLQRYHKLIPWGDRTKIVTAIMSLTLDYIEERGGWAGIGEILDGKVVLVKQENDL